MQASALQVSQESFVPLHADSLHDLTSPVNQISTMLELFVKRRASQPEIANDPILNLIRESTARLQKMVSALQECHRLTAAPPDIRHCESSALLAAALASLEPEIRESEADLTQGDLPGIHCDPSQMCCVFTSLIGNAIKFRGQDRPQIRISAEKRDREWLFSIRDNGIGIDARHHAAVFHMFRKVQGDQYPGAGAGLAIARRIVERHGGRIWVESQSGQGCRVLFTVKIEPWQPACTVQTVPTVG